MATTFEDIETNFHSMPLTKFEIHQDLELEWLKNAIADYELELGCDLGYDPDMQVFAGDLSNVTIRVLALMMYVCYLQRELSRVMALNAIYGRDIQITGGDATKRVTKAEMESEMSRVRDRLHRLKQNSFA